HVLATGTPADGYRIGSIESAPAKARARAPSKEIANLETVDTEAVDVTGLTADTDRPAAITTTGEMMRIEPTEGIVKIGITPVIATRDFHGVPLTVRDSGLQCVLRPPRVNLTLRGAKLQLSKLDLSGTVFVDGDGMEPGTYNAPVQVQLPQGMELL